jgi:hypothetical protein
MSLHSDSVHFNNSSDRQTDMSLHSDSVHINNNSQTDMSLHSDSVHFNNSSDRQTCHSTWIQYTLTTVQTDRHVTPLGFSTLLTTVHRQTDMSLHSYSVHFNNSSDRPTCHSTQILSMMLHEVLFYLNWIVVNIWYSGTCAIWHLHFPTLCDIRQKFMVPKYFS